MSELSPCPFCGGTDLRYMNDVVMPDNWHTACVHCSDCDAQGPGSKFWYDTDEEAEGCAAKQWNKHSEASIKAKAARELAMKRPPNSVQRSWLLEMAEKYEQED